MSAHHIADVISAVLLVLGTGLMLLGALGILRLPDLFTRAQAASKSSTLGLAVVFIAVAVNMGDLGSIAQALAVIAFAFLSVPVGVHAIVRAAHSARTPMWPPCSVDELADSSEDNECEE